METRAIDEALRRRLIEAGLDDDGVARIATAARNAHLRHGSRIVGAEIDAMGWPSGRAPEDLEQLGVARDAVSGFILEEGPNPFHWEFGDLSIWRAAADLPDTTLAAVVGRPVTDVVSHRLLDDGMRIVGTRRQGGWTTFRLDGWARPLR